MKISKTIRTWVVVLSVLFAAGLAGRLILANQLERAISTQLAALPDFSGTYSDVDISLVKGGFSIRNLVLKKNSKIPDNFFEVQKVSFYIDWSSLPKGALVSKVIAESPSITFVKGPTPASSQTAAPFDWISLVKEINPLPINEIIVNGGVIHFRDYHTEPKVELAMNDIHIFATNLENVENEEKILSAKVTGNGKVQEGVVRLNMELNTFYKLPTFKLDAELTNLDLGYLNEFLKAYGNFDIQNGLFSMYTEAETKNNKIIGFVKPVIEDINVASWSNQHKNDTMLRPWSTGDKPTFIPVSGELKSLPDEIKFEGVLDDANLNLWTATGITLHNAFIEALMPSLQTSIQKHEDAPVVRPKNNVAAKVSASEEKKDSKKKGFLKRIFRKKEDKGKKEERRKKD